MTMFEFWAHVAVGKKTECWPWLGGKDSNGYGLLNLEGQVVRAHRVAFLWRGAKLGHREGVLHACDNPSCCNPNHLFAGTQAVNMADAAKKDRMLVCGQHKLTAWQLVEIKALAGSTLTQQAIADRFGITQPTVSRIFNQQRKKYQ